MILFEPGWEAIIGETAAWLMLEDVMSTLSVKLYCCRSRIRLSKIRVLGTIMRRTRKRLNQSSSLHGLVWIRFGSNIWRNSCIINVRGFDILPFIMIYYCRSRIRLTQLRAVCTIIGGIRKRLNQNNHLHGLAWTRLRRNIRRNSCMINVRGCDVLLFVTIYCCRSRIRLSQIRAVCTVMGRTGNRLNQNNSLHDFVWTRLGSNIRRNSCMINVWRYNISLIRYGMLLQKQDNVDSNQRYLHGHRRDWEAFEPEQ